MAINFFYKLPKNKKIWNVYLQNWAIKKCREVFDIKTYTYAQYRYTIMGTIKLSWKFLSAIRVTTPFISSYFVLYYTIGVICNFKLYGNSQKRIYYCWLYRRLIGEKVYCTTTLHTDFARKLILHVFATIAFRSNDVHIFLVS